VIHGRKLSFRLALSLARRWPDVANPFSLQVHYIEYVGTDHANLAQAKRWASLP